MEIAYSFCSPQVFGNICSFSALGPVCPSRKSHCTGPKLTHSFLVMQPCHGKHPFFPLTKPEGAGCLMQPASCSHLLFDLFIIPLSLKWESDTSPCVCCSPGEILITRLEKSDKCPPLFQTGVTQSLHSPVLFRESLFPKSSKSRHFYVFYINEKSKRSFTNSHHQLWSIYVEIQNYLDCDMLTLCFSRNVPPEAPLLLFVVWLSLGPPLHQTWRFRFEFKCYDGSSLFSSENSSNPVIISEYKWLREGRLFPWSIFQKHLRLRARLTKPPC